MFRGLDKLGEVGAGAPRLSRGQACAGVLSTTNQGKRAEAAGYYEREKKEKDIKKIRIRPYFLASIIIVLILSSLYLFTSPTAVFLSDPA